MVLGLYLITITKYQSKKKSKHKMELTQIHTSLDDRLAFREVLNLPNTPSIINMSRIPLLSHPPTVGYFV